MRQRRMDRIAALIIAFALASVLCGFAPSDGSTVPDLKLINTQVLDATGLQGVEAHYISDSITLLESENDSITLKEYLSYNHASYRAMITTEDVRLRIQAGNRPENTSYRSRIELYIPADFSGSIKISTASGSVESTGTSFGGPVSIISASGKITLLQVAFPLNVDSSSGSVHVECAALQGRIRTASGAISLIGDTFIGDLMVMSASGGISVSLPANTSFKLEASTASGRIINGFSGGNTAKGYKSSYGASPVYTLDISSASGNIDLDAR